MPLLVISSERLIFPRLKGPCKYVVRVSVGMVGTAWLCTVVSEILTILCPDMPKHTITGVSTLKKAYSGRYSGMLMLAAKGLNVHKIEALLSNFFPIAPEMNGLGQYREVICANFSSYNLSGFTIVAPLHTP